MCTLPPLEWICVHCVCLCICVCLSICSYLPVDDILSSLRLTPAMKLWFNGVSSTVWQAAVGPGPRTNAVTPSGNGRLRPKGAVYQRHHI